MFLGEYEIDDTILITLSLADITTGSHSDADSTPSYRFCEGDDGPTDAAFLTGSFAKVDDNNTVGQYKVEITLSSGNGFTSGKNYCVVKQATVNSITASVQDQFKIVATKELWPL